MTAKLPQLEVPEPAHSSVAFNTYKACADLVSHSEAFELPIGPLTPVQAPSGAARRGVPISFVESEAYCRSNNLLLVCNATFACFGQAGFFIFALGADGQRLFSQVSDQPVLSAVAESNSRDSRTAMVAYTTAEGSLVLMGIEASTGKVLRSAAGSLPGADGGRIWVSSMKLKKVPDETGDYDEAMVHVLVHRLRMEGSSRRPKVELMAVQLKFQDGRLASETMCVWHGTALPRASSWSNTAVLVVSSAIFTTATTPVCGSEDAMDADQEGIPGCYDLDAEAAIMTVLPLTDSDADCAMEGQQTPAPSTRSWILPRGNLLAARDVGSGGLALLLESGVDALACQAVLSCDRDGSPAIDSLPQRFSGLACVARARQNLRLCLCSHASTFCGLFEAAGSNAATVFRNPAGEAAAPTFSVPLGYEEEVLGAHLAEDALYVLTPSRISRFALHASVRCASGGPPLPLGAKLPGGIDAAALLRMLDAAED